MCVVAVNINETLVRDIFPELNTMDALNKWVQEEIDRRIEELRDEEDIMDIEDARAMVHETVRQAYASL